MSGSAPGAPLRAMASVTVIWIVARVISWHSPANISWPPVTSVDGRTLRHAAGPETKKLRQAALSEPVHEQKARSRPHVRYVRGSATTGAMPMQPAVSAYPSRPAPWPYPVEIRDFFLQAALRPPGTNPNEAAIAIQRFPNSSPASRNNRLAAYFWIHARQKSGAKQGFQGKSGRSAANGQYGGSQAGAILSYRLSDEPDPDMALYSRISAALAPVSQREIAVGARIRPLRNLPLAGHAEQRFDADGGSVAGTAFYMTGGTGPEPVVGRLMLETYAQAGYVLGRDETYFFDGSATVQRLLAESAGQTLAAGAGLWAGGQRGIRRLDVGPRASINLTSGSQSTRIAIDGRIRVAGNARPGSGAALTVSTSF